MRRARTRDASPGMLASPGDEFNEIIIVNIALPNQLGGSYKANDLLTSFSCESYKGNELVLHMDLLHNVCKWISET